MKQRYINVSKILFCFGILLFGMGTYIEIDNDFLNNQVGVQELLLSQNNIEIDEGDSFLIYGVIFPSNATDKEITWSSSDSSIATVVNGKITGIKSGNTIVSAKTSNGNISICKVKVLKKEIVQIEEEQKEETLPPKETPKSKINPVTLVHIKIPTYNQGVEGYPLGCEGVSLYMALKGLGYMNDYSLQEFMDTMPKGDTPFDGYSGNPKIGHAGENLGKRTSIYPGPLSDWASKFVSSKDLTGATVEELKKELKEGHVLLVFVTTGWKTPIWKKYSWSTNPRGEIENNHCLCIVGFRSNGDFLVNDCHDGRKDGRRGEYWVKANLFKSIYNVRNYAISVF